MTVQSVAEEPSSGVGTAGRIPPGQRHVHGWPVSHYGPVPRFRPVAAINEWL
jgi:hypothetical protein